ncbi:VTT domain-containing protein [Candidatus Pacearchaeota archaeon]|nr:VTT domain-containing protein [Candidatus Pacearchaeota archaeon]
MEFLIIDFILHIDKYIGIFMENYGLLTYLILFAIIFLETGLVFTPLLPGDSLLFVSGTLAASGSINILLLFFILSIAAILGDSVNYWMGNYLGKKISSKRFVRKEYLQRTRDFYDKYGVKTIIIARFIPIVRTFAPFIAGIGKMNYSRFLVFNVVGGILWVGIFVFSGFFFGGIPLIEKNLNYVIILIIIISLIPVFLEFFRKKR